MGLGVSPHLPVFKKCTFGGREKKTRKMKSSVQTPLSLSLWLLIECEFFRLLCMCASHTHSSTSQKRVPLLSQGLSQRLGGEETAMQSSLGREDPLEEEMATHSSILAGKSHGQRSPMGCSLLGLKKSDMTEVTDFSLVMKETAPVLTCGNILPTKWKNRLKTRRSKCFLEKLRLYIRRAHTVNS